MNTSDLKDTLTKKALSLAVQAAIPAAACAGGVLAGAAFLTAPGITCRRKMKPFMRRTFAHRGLYTKDQDIPENSLAAFTRAVNAGYGIELDIQLSLEGEVVVFHDKSLLRACGVDKDVEELTLAELRELRLFGTDEGIPLFTEVLSRVAGTVPLIVELKTMGKRNRELCEKAKKILANYRRQYGDTDDLFCIESFDPRIVTWFRFHMPQICRGQLACLPAAYNDSTPRVAAHLFGNCLCNVCGRPHFVAYELGRRPLTVHLANALGAARVAWTSHLPEDRIGQDAVIFEHYRPDLRF